MNWYKMSHSFKAYHGTNQNFDVFEIGIEYQDQKARTSKEGFWFTDSIEEAKEYADYSAKRSIPDQIEHEKKIQEYMKRIQKAEQQKNWPLQEKLINEMEVLEYNAINSEPQGQKVMEVILTLNNPYIVNADEKDFDIEQTIYRAKSQGYDGIIFNQIFDSPKMFSYPGAKRTTQYLVFNANNIKVKNTIDI